MEVKKGDLTDHIFANPMLACKFQIPGGDIASTRSNRIDLALPSLFNMSLFRILKIEFWEKCRRTDQPFCGTDR